LPVRFQNVLPVSQEGCSDQEEEQGKGKS
jgi:hypothetical protein